MQAPGPRPNPTRLRIPFPKLPTPTPRATAGRGQTSAHWPSSPRGRAVGSWPPAHPPAPGHQHTPGPRSGTGWRTHSRPGRRVRERHRGGEVCLVRCPCHQPGHQPQRAPAAAVPAWPIGRETRSGQTRTILKGEHIPLCPQCLLQGWPRWPGPQPWPGGASTLAGRSRTVCIELGTSHRPGSCCIWPQTPESEHLFVAAQGPTATKGRDCPVPAGLRRLHPHHHPASAPPHCCPAQSSPGRTDVPVKAPAAPGPSPALALCQALS